MDLIAALDQGTTSTRVIVFDKTSQPVAAHQIQMEQHHPEAGWVEQEPEDYIKNAIECFAEVEAQLREKSINVARVKCLGITNQRETTIVWDKTTGKPLYRAVVWSDVRTTNTVEKLSAKPGAEEVIKRCGLPLNSYFAGVKLRWLLDNRDDIREVYEAGNLCFSTIDAWFIYKLSGKNQRFATDVTNASRSMFMNIKTLQYDPWLLDFFEVQKINLPEICSGAEVYTHMDLGGHLNKLNGSSVFHGMPISGSLGDQSAALVGHLGFNKGDAKNTYGTGCFLLFNTGDEPVFSEQGLITTIMFQQKGRRPLYALEGSIAVAGSVIQWLRDGLGIIETSSQVGDLASQVPDNGGVIFVTAFSGLFAPYWRPDARGTLLGLTQFTTKAHICRAALEATCFQTKAILDSMLKDSQRDSSTKLLTRLRVDGGLTGSNVAMQIQADILGVEVERPRMREPTALGAAIAAGIGMGLWDSVEQVRADMLPSQEEGKTLFTTSLEEAVRNQRYELWQKGVERAVGWA